MPQMGVSVAEGTIIEWLKRPGDAVAADETVCEVTTDKIDVEIPAPAAGRLERILVEVGETVAVGTPLAEIDAFGEARRGPPRGGSRARRRSGAGDERRRSTRRDRHYGCDRRRADRSRFYSPVVRRIAGEHGIDLAAVEGHGSAAGSARRPARADRATAAPPSRARRRPLHSESPYTPETGPDRNDGARARRRRPRRRVAGRAPRAAEPDAAGDRRAHARQPPDLGPLHDDRRGRLLGRVAARRAELRS